MSSNNEQSGFGRDYDKPDLEDYLDDLKEFSRKHSEILNELLCDRRTLGELRATMLVNFGKPYEGFTGGRIEHLVSHKLKPVNMLITLLETLHAQAKEVAAVCEHPRPKSHVLPLEDGYPVEFLWCPECGAFSEPGVEGWLLPSRIRQDDDYVTMPRKLTAENGAKALLIGEFEVAVEYPNPSALEGSEYYCDDEPELLQDEVAVPWTTIKKIYEMAVENLAKGMRDE